MHVPFFLNYVLKHVQWVSMSGFFRINLLLLGCLLTLISSSEARLDDSSAGEITNTDFVGLDNTSFDDAPFGSIGRDAPWNRTFGPEDISDAGFFGESFSDGSDEDEGENYTGQSIIDEENGPLSDSHDLKPGSEDIKEALADAAG